MKVLDFIFHDSWIAKARPVDHFHALFDNVWMCWIAHLKEILLFEEIHSVVLIQIGDDKVADVSGRGFLQTACQFK